MAQSIAEYVLAQQSKEYVGIPICLPRLNKIVCQVDKGDSYIITAQTSTFKSSFLMGGLVIPSIEWILEREKAGLNIRVFYFLLEENRQDLEIRMLSHIFYRDFGLEVSENKLHGRGEEKLSPLEKKVLPQAQARLDRILAKMEIIHTIHHGYGIYLHVKTYLEKTGVVVPETTDAEGNLVESYYRPNNPEEYVYVVVDHVGDMIASTEEKTLFMAIENLTGKYLMKLKNFYRAIPFVVQQQTNVGDQIATDFKGKTIESKLSPSTADLADNKSSAKRATTIISLFNPAAYELETYKGYNYIRAMKGLFLYLEVLKNRRGPKKVGGGIWVHPISKTFEEYPAASDISRQMAFLGQRGIGVAAPSNAALPARRKALPGDSSGSSEGFSFDDMGSRSDRINRDDTFFDSAQAA